MTPATACHLSSAGYGNGAGQRHRDESAHPRRPPRHTPALAGMRGATGIDRTSGTGRSSPSSTACARQVGHGPGRPSAMQILWSSDAERALALRPAGRSSRSPATPGSYRFLVSTPRPNKAGFATLPSRARRDPHPPGVRLHGRAGLLHSRSCSTTDLPPSQASGGRITFIVNGKRRLVTERTASAFPIPAGARCEHPPRMGRARPLREYQSAGDPVALSARGIHHSRRSRAHRSS